MLLVHGGAGPVPTWKGLEQLADRWTLATLYRRGFDPSPPPTSGRQDFDEDATDIASVLAARPHVVAHSYGAVGTVLAAIREPARVRSLTLLEPAIHPLEDLETRRWRRIGEACLTDGLDADPTLLRQFLRIAGSPVPDEGPLPDHAAQAVRRAHGSRSPYEARPALHRIRAAGIPTLVASGGHADIIERNAEAVADQLGAERIVCPGAGHFVAAAPDFAAELERFLTRANRRLAASPER
ncbi:MAG TPA: alpha/beta hydrolase [Solirubrobacterales bacterium]|nr:alpha/beta hydrolase [Solirubrobacterales bacterium]